MKLAPRNNQIIGRTTIKRSDSRIIRLDETKVTKFILVDAVGDGAAAAGIKIGDVLLGTRINTIVFDAGLRSRTMLEEQYVACFLTGLTPDELFVQKENGQEFVPFDSPEAAENIGAQLNQITEAQAAE